MNKIFIIVIQAISGLRGYPRHCAWRFFSAKMGTEGGYALMCLGDTIGSVG